MDDKKKGMDGEIKILQLFLEENVLKHPKVRLIELKIGRFSSRNEVSWG